ncbi:hypothetical protein fugu_008708 [Takifugu bimaculatus]|uniref:THAP-type domain-containing protein n=1 Tax=Takifugu bimaculatus TaxID=433685 RepID=A0A4Z2B0X6_9TELE|nr:hypothetical protein fugu_008708 [Takifugu bimaculatus]
MQNRCAVPSCAAQRPNSRPLFRFPLDPDRSEKWVSRCQNPDVLSRAPEHLYKYYRICADHFEPSAFNDTEESVLKSDAVPTVAEDTTKGDESEKKGRNTVEGDVQAPAEESQHREYLKSLFEILLLLGGQNIPPNGPGEGCGSTNFQALMEYQKSCADGVRQKSCESSKESPTQSAPMVEALEKWVHHQLLEEVKQSGAFSIITDDVVELSGERCVPVFLRFVDRHDVQQDRFAGFWSLGGSEERLATELLSELEEWGLDMKQCRAQAHSSRNMQTLAGQLLERYPQAFLTPRSPPNLNLSLAGGMAPAGVQLVLSTLRKMEAFFSQSPLLQVELDNAISIYFPEKEEAAQELKEACRSNWTGQNEAFEVAAQILEPLLLCVDSIHDNEEMRWSDEVANAALDISKAITSFEFVMALVVLKNTLALTRAFGANLRGQAADRHFAASSLEAVLHSLQEVSDNIDVYHEFWTDEAINLATAMEIPIKVPRAFLRKHPSAPGAVRLESHYRDRLSAPVVQHVIRELTRLFGEQHLGALKCLSLVPLVMAQQRGAPEPQSVLSFHQDLPNAGVLPEELHCWQVKWSKQADGDALPPDVHQALRLADLRFFPNVRGIFRALGVLPSSSPEDGSDVAYRRLQGLLENTPDPFKSKSLIFLSMNCDVVGDLDEAVEAYSKAHPDSERP